MRKGSLQGRPRPSSESYGSRPNLDSQVEALLANINSRHGTTFAVRSRAAAGESGSTFVLVDCNGEEFVLKCGHGAEARPEEAAKATKRLRRVGFPAPSYVRVGDNEGLKYSIQAMMPGRPCRRFNASLARELIAINRLQTGLAGDLPPEWPSRVIDGVLKGFDGYCEIKTLRRYSVETAALLETLQNLVVHHSAEIFITRDIVHWDFNPGNVLSDGTRITGVIDWDGVCAGDRSFDLSTCLFYSYDDREVRDLLWREVSNSSGHGALSVYLAHMIVRQVDWSIRHHDSAWTAGWMATAKNIIHDLLNHRSA